MTSYNEAIEVDKVYPRFLFGFPKLSCDKHEALQNIAVLISISLNLSGVLNRG
jgi:hypothetical protein